jgi:hypothetical protein
MSLAEGTEPTGIAIVDNHSWGGAGGSNKVENITVPPIAMASQKRLPLLCVQIMYREVTLARLYTEP